MTYDWRTGQYLDGPATADWFEGWMRRRHDVSRWDRRDDQHGFERYHGGDTATRAIYRWRHENVTPSVYSLDRLLTRFGGHISDIPDHLWITKGPSRGPRREITPELREAVVRMAETEPVGVVAKRFQVSEKSVRNWKKALATR